MKIYKRPLVSVSVLKLIFKRYKVISLQNILDFTMLKKLNIIHLHYSIRFEKRNYTNKMHEISQFFWFDFFPNNIIGRPLMVFQTGK